MFDSLTNPTLLDDMLLDKAAHRLRWRKYLTNNTEYEIWRKWLYDTV